jgi:hypothetical protein
LKPAANKPSFEGMRKEPLAESRAGHWTRPEDYVTAMAVKTLPFLALLGALALLAVGIMVVAFPGTQPQLKHERIAAREQGVAAKGWFQEAQKEFHR